MDPVTLHPSNKNQFRKFPYKATSSLLSETGIQVSDDLLLGCRILSSYGQHRIYTPQLYRSGTVLRVTVANVDDRVVLGVLVGDVSKSSQLTFTSFNENCTGSATAGNLESLPDGLVQFFLPDSAEIEESNILLLAPPALRSLSDRRGNKLRGHINVGTLTNVAVDNSVGIKLQATNPSAVLNTADKSSYIGTCPTPLIKTVNGLSPTPATGVANNDNNIYLVGVQPLAFYGVPVSGGSAPGVLGVETEGMTLTSLCTQRQKLLPPVTVEGFTLNTEDYQDKYYTRPALPEYQAGGSNYPLARPSRVASNFNSAEVPEYYFWPQFATTAAYLRWLSRHASAPYITGIVGLSNDGDRLTISFVPPTKAGLLATTNYEYTLNAGVTWTAVSPASLASPIVVTGLTPGQTFQVQLRTVDTAGVGQASDVTTVTTTSPFTGWQGGCYFQYGVQQYGLFTVAGLKYKDCDGLYTGWEGLCHYTAGVLATGLFTVSGTRYKDCEGVFTGWDAGCRYESGVLQTGIFTVAGLKYTGCAGLYTGWDGGCHYINGAAETGLFTVSGLRYKDCLGLYTGWDGACHFTSGVQDSGVFVVAGLRYKDCDGLYTGWDGGYHYTAGARDTGVFQVAGLWYKDNEGLFTGWDAGCRYESGVLQTGLFTVAGVRYQNCTGAYTGWDGACHFTTGLQDTGLFTVAGLRYQDCDGLYTGWEGDCHYTNGVLATGVFTVEGLAYKDCEGLYTGWDANCRYEAGVLTTGLFTIEGLRYQDCNGLYTGWEEACHFTSGVQDTGLFTVEGLRYQDCLGLYTGWEGDCHYTDGVLATGIFTVEGFTYKDCEGLYTGWDADCYYTAGVLSTGVFTVEGLTYKDCEGLFSGIDGGLLYVSGILASGIAFNTGDNLWHDYLDGVDQGVVADGTFLALDGLWRSFVSGVGTLLTGFAGDGCYYIAGDLQTGLFTVAGLKYQDCLGLYTGYDGIYYYDAGALLTGFTGDGCYFIGGVLQTGLFTVAELRYLDCSGIYTGWDGGNYYDAGVLQTGAYTVSGINYYGPAGPAGFTGTADGLDYLNGVQLPVGYSYVSTVLKLNGQSFSGAVVNAFSTAYFVAGVESTSPVAFAPLGGYDSLYDNLVYTSSGLLTDTGNTVAGNGQPFTSYQEILGLWYGVTAGGTQTLLQGRHSEPYTGFIPPNHTYGIPYYFNAGVPTLRMRDAGGGQWVVKTSLGDIPVNGIGTIPSLSESTTYTFTNGYAALYTGFGKHSNYSRFYNAYFLNGAPVWETDDGNVAVIRPSDFGGTDTNYYYVNGSSYSRVVQTELANGWFEGWYYIAGARQTGVFNVDGTYYEGNLGTYTGWLNTGDVLMPETYIYYGAPRLAGRGVVDGTAYDWFYGPYDPSPNYDLDGDPFVSYVDNSGVWSGVTASEASALVQGRRDDILPTPGRYFFTNGVPAPLYAQVDGLWCQATSVGYIPIYGTTYTDVVDTSGTQYVFRGGAAVPRYSSTDGLWYEAFAGRDLLLATALDLPDIYGWYQVPNLVGDSLIHCYIAGVAQVYTGLMRTNPGWSFVQDGVVQASWSTNGYSTNIEVQSSWSPSVVQHLGGPGNPQVSTVPTYDRWYHIQVYQNPVLLNGVFTPWNESVAYNFVDGVKGEPV